MKVTVCIGSSCHLKGTFCLGQCQRGVCVTIDDEMVYSVSPDTVEEFFRTEIQEKL